MPQSLFLPFSGGIDLQAGIHETAVGESPDMLNMLPDISGKFLRKRDGSKKQSGLAFSKIGITAGYRSYDADGSTRMTLLVTKDRLYTNNAVGVIAQVDTFTANPTYAFFERMVDSSGNTIIVICGPDDNTFSNVALKYNANAGTAANLGGTPPKAWFPIEFQRYMFMWNVDISGTKYTNRGYFSARDNAESWDTTNDFLRVPYHSGVVSGAGKLFDVQHIFCERAVYGITGTTFSSTAGVGNQRVSDAIIRRGCIAPYSLVNTGDAYIFLSEDGIRTMDSSGNSQIISYKIQSIIKRIVQGTPFVKAAGVYDPSHHRYFFAYEDSQRQILTGHNTEVLCCDLSTLQWYPLRYSFPIRSFFSTPSFGDRKRIHACNSDDGFTHAITEVYELSDSKREISLADFETDESWVEGAFSAGSIAADVTNFTEGDQGLRLTTASAAGEQDAYLIKSLNAAVFKDLFIDNSTSSPEPYYFLCRVYINDIANVDTIKIYISTSNGAVSVVGDYDDDIVLTVLGSDDGMATGWNTIKVPVSSFAGSSRGFWSSVNRIAVYYQSQTSADYVTFDDFRIVQNQRAGIDSYVVSKAVGLLEPIVGKSWIGARLNCDRFEDSEIDFRAIVNGKPVASETKSAQDISLHVYRTKQDLFHLEQLETGVVGIFKSTPIWEPGLETSYAVAAGIQLDLASDNSRVYFAVQDSPWALVRSLTGKNSSLSLDASLSYQAGADFSMTPFNACQYLDVDSERFYMPIWDGSSAWFDLHVVDKATFSLIRKVSMMVDGTIATRCLSYKFDNDYLYVIRAVSESQIGSSSSYATNFRLSKYNKSDFINKGIYTLAEEVDIPSFVSAQKTITYGPITVDDTFIYMQEGNSSTDRFLKKYTKEKLTLLHVSYINSVTGLARGIAIDGHIFYVADYDADAIRRFKKTDLGEVAAGSWHDINGITTNNVGYQTHSRQSVEFPIRSYGDWCQVSFGNKQSGQDLRVYGVLLLQEPSEKVT